MSNEVGKKQQTFAVGDTVIVHIQFPHNTDRYSLGKIVDKGLNPDNIRWCVKYDLLTNQAHESWFGEADMFNLRSDLIGVFSDIVNEHGKRFAKWGEQDYPMVDPWYSAPTKVSNAFQIAMHYGIPTEAFAKQICELFFKENRGSWFHVIIEELAESLAATLLSRKALRKELIQLASVVIGAIESLDRNGK